MEKVSEEQYKRIAETGKIRAGLAVLKDPLWERSGVASRDHEDHGRKPKVDATSRCLCLLRVLGGESETISQANLSCRSN
jgi:hypothetical protein